MITLMTVLIEVPDNEYEYVKEIIIGLGGVITDEAVVG